MLGTKPGTSTRASGVLINLGLKNSQMAKGGGKSTVRGALYESTSIAAVYGTDCSLVNHGAARLWYTSTRNLRGEKCAEVPRRDSYDGFLRRRWSTRGLRIWNARRAFRTTRHRRSAPLVLAEQSFCASTSRP